MSSNSGSKTAVYAALVGNLLIAIVKFIAAAFTGSSAMLSEGVHSFVDTGNEVLLLYGMHRAAKPPDTKHPLGHGRELYFWSFIVALLIFSIGAGVSLYEGISHILSPHPVDNVAITYWVLGISVVFEGVSWTVAFREFREKKGSLGYIAAVLQSKDPTTFTVLFEDSAALLGLLAAFVGIFLAEHLHMPELDGVASVVIAVLLAGTALFLARESKGLLLGEPASERLQASILEIAERDPAVHRANGVVTVHLGPDQIVAALSTEFEDSLTAPEIEACVERLEKAIQAANPQVTTLFIKPQTAHHWQQREEAVRAGDEG
jgi:cation diffusion facilitator family transporter